MLNYRGIRQAAAVQNVLTVAKVAGLGIVIGSVFLSHGASSSQSASSSHGVSWTGLTLAMLACGWAYDGWHAVSFVAGEVKRPERNLPLSLGFGMAIICTIYVLANVAYLRVFSQAALAATERAGVAVAEQTMGPLGAALATAAILVSIAGSVNASVLAPPRVYFAQARDGLFFSIFGEVHPRFETPWFAILCQGLWSALLAVTGSFETLLTYAMFANWVFGALTVIGLVLLRIRRPELPRPYRMWGYPFTPLLLAGYTVAAAPLPSLAGIGLISAGIAVYYSLKH